MLVRNNGAAVGYLLAACSYARDPLHGKEPDDGLRNIEKMRKELTLFLRRLRRHLLPKEGGFGSTARDEWSGPFLRKGLRGAVGIGQKNMRKELTPLSSVA